MPGSTSSEKGIPTVKPSSLTVGLVVDHAKAVRIPLLIILITVVLTFWVDQIRELFLLLTTTTHVWHQVGTLVMAGALGFAVWHTARSVYRFDIPSIPSLSNPKAEVFRKWAPRYLGAAVPLLMAVGSLTALFDKSLKNAEEEPRFWMPVLFIVETVALLVFVILRRELFGGVFGLSKTPAGDPRVSHWSQLPRSVRMVYAVIVFANVLALVLAAEVPGFLSHMGTLALALMCACFLTVTGTYLTIQTARWQFPLLSALFALAVVLQFFGVTDNHRVRLYEGMHSFSSPNEGSIDREPVISTSLVDYTKKWSAGPPPLTPVYLVSSEGGGIRAAAWTALVLDELEIQSEGEFSKHMLLGSGVSGGSLGLAWFAAIVRGEREGVIKLDDIRPMAQLFYETDFLGPMLETMFLTDFLQRFVPSAQFVDRGERLESGWETGWAVACRTRPSANAVATQKPRVDVCSLFGSPWKSLGMAADRVPALFLNSTEAQSGRRFIEEPFASLRGVGQDDAVVNAATLSTDWLPASSPLSAVVHNSARFTYVSPAGTLLDISAIKGGTPVPRQLVDGGYFDNSGATTLAELVLLARDHVPGCSGPSGLGSETCPVRIIHISNDPGVETMRSDDSCHASDDSRAFSAYGEIRGPLLALLNTREARGAVARAAVRSLFAQGKALESETDPLTDAFVFHFRLCKGVHHLPLGWTLSAEAMSEMRRQLVGLAASAPGGFNHKQLDLVTAQVATSKRVP